MEYGFSKIKFSIKQNIKELMQNAVLPVFYRLARGKVDRKLVVLADSHHNRCPEDMKLIRNKLTDRGYDVVGYFFDMNKLSVMGSLRKMIKFMSLYKKAGTVIVCSYFLPVAACRKRKETMVINVWHGCGAMKQFGYDSKEDIPEHYKGNPFANTDIMCVSGEACVKPFESAMRYDEAMVLPIGVSVTDLYYNEGYKAKCLDTFNRCYPEVRGRKVVLWAPTFRQNAAFATCVGEEDIDSLMKDEKILSEYYIIKSLHPNTGAKSKSKGMSTRELMVCSDILITDYSSLWFEYLLLDRPIIFYAPDYNRYMSDRGLYLDYDDVPGCIIKDNVYELKEMLINKKFNNEIYDLKRKKFSDIYMGGCDGKATNRLLEEIDGKK